MKTKIKTPYRAIILGEERVVEDWDNERIITDKGEFVFQRLLGKDVEAEVPSLVGIGFEHPLPLGYLLEVATIRTNRKGEWLLNDRKLSTLCWLPAGQRLLPLTASKVLRARQREIRAVAWFRVCSHGNETGQLDMVLADWREARKPKLVVPPISLKWLNSNPLLGWSAPVWLASFRPLNTEDDVPVADEEEWRDAPQLVAGLVRILMAISDHLDSRNRRPPTASLIFKYVCRDGMTVREIMRKHPGWSEKTIKWRKQKVDELLATRFHGMTLKRLCISRKVFAAAAALLDTAKSERESDALRGGES